MASAYTHVISFPMPLPFSTIENSIQLLMNTTNTLQEIESRMTIRALGAVHNPGNDPLAAKVLKLQLEV